MTAEVVALTQRHPRWQEMADFAESSDWPAGPFLAREMRKNAFLPWERVLGLWVDGRAAGYCTLTANDEMPPENGFSPFIGFVYVAPAFRGRRLSRRLIDAAADWAGQCGFAQVYLMSGEKGLYEKYGFEPLGEYDTIFRTRDQLFVRRI